MRAQLICIHPSGAPEGLDLVLPARGIDEVHLGGRALAQGAQIQGEVCVGGIPLEAGFVALSAESRRGGPRVIPVEKGAFYSGVLEPGTYGLVLRIGTFIRDNDHEYMLDGIVVGGGPSKVELNLPSGVIRGRVIRIGAACTEPVEGVLVQAERDPKRGTLPKGLKFSIAGRAKTDGFGRFEIPVLPDGRYRVRFQWSGEGEAEKKTVKVEIRGGQGGDLGEVSL